MNQQFTTKDTSETVTAPQLPADDRTGSGYDWMETLTGTPWDTLASWGSEGWDAGSWPYIIFASATHADAAGPLYGYGPAIPAADVPNVNIFAASPVMPRPIGAKKVEATDRRHVNVSLGSFNGAT